MMAYHYDPVKMIADVLIEEFEQGNLGINSTGKHLKRSAGPCNFCHNELWNFETDQGCMYGVDTKQYTNGYLEDLAKKYFTGGIC
jgi:cytidine deaminase